MRMDEFIRSQKQKKAMKEKLGPEKGGLMEEALGVKREAPKTEEEIKEARIRAKLLYQKAIDHIRDLMAAVKQGEVIEGSEPIEVAKEIIEKICVDHTTLLMLTKATPGYEHLYTHSVNVCILATNIGRVLNYSKDKLLDLAISALLHDIGMIEVPHEILMKPTELTRAEYDEIKKHPIHGLRHMEKIKGAINGTPLVAYQEHERVAGTGYPESKTGKEIHEFAKIVAVTDVYEALTHPRPHRKEFLPYEAMKIIIDAAGSDFDPELVKIMLDHLTLYPVGSFVKLNTGQIGRVVQIDPGYRMRPTVDIYFDSEGNRLKAKKRINLAKQSVLYIKDPVDERTLKGVPDFFEE